MPIDITPQQIKGEEFELVTDGSGDFVLTHIPSTAEWKYSTSASAWVPVEGLDLQSADIANVGSLGADSGVFASELGAPEYDDISNAPQTRNRVAAATGNGVTQEGLYRHNGTSYEQVGGSGALSDSGNDTDGGNDYQLPTASDNIDLQGDGAVRNADEVTTKLIDSTKSFSLAYLSSLQTITSGSVTKVTFDAVESDHLGGFDTTNNEFVVQDDGDYAVSGQIYWNSDSNWTDGNRADPRPNAGGARIAGPQVAKNGTFAEGVAISTSARTLNAGDVIDLRCFQDSGADQTLDKGKQKTFLTIQKVG